jgi:hypothetical protein
LPNVLELASNTLMKYTGIPVANLNETIAR